ncbi:uncharacterized protein LOC120273171 [Dioscorea cayenensis subsp. rotundata]|uniref:Uncharacterized protein LOC120273171 n=1 Tax=Dioscorea cayennensis subsp. rotundata TaxID=55577 RepID=A0AB40C9F6_DIOCR|nr:uncharacterized protein LOC120273171 [Dioscorea cayenensis subsp. rotundata]
MGRKRKLEMRFDDILNMEAIFMKGRTSILRVELKRVPEMGIEKEPEHGKHTIWIGEDDFTRGQVHVNMIYEVEFEEGILEQHYERLLIVEPRFRGINQLNSSMEGSTFELIRNNVGSLANHVNFNNPVVNVQPINGFGSFGDQRQLTNEFASIQKTLANNEVHFGLSEGPEGLRAEITENNSLTMNVLNSQPSNNFRNLDEISTYNGLHHRSNEIAKEQIVQNVDFQKMKDPMNNNLRHSLDENNSNPLPTNEEGIP